MARVQRLAVTIITESRKHCSDHCPLLRKVGRGNPKAGHCSALRVDEGQFVHNSLPLMFDPSEGLYERSLYCRSDAVDVRDEPEATSDEALGI